MGSHVAYVDLCRDRKIVRLHCRGAMACIEVFSLGEKEETDLKAAFECSLADLRGVLDGGAFQITVDDRHLLLRATKSEIWIIVAVPAEGFSESCLVPRQAFVQALAAFDRN